MTDKKKKKDYSSLTMLTKAHLIERLIEKNPHLTVRDIEEATKKIFECMLSSLSSGGRIEIRGFGTFSLRTRKEYIARNPKTGQVFPSPQKSVPYFRAGKRLRELVNNSVNGTNNTGGADESAFLTKKSNNQYERQAEPPYSPSGNSDL